MLINHCSNAQWVQSNGTFGGAVVSLAVSGNNIFAGTSGFGVYFSTNNGDTWVQTTLNNRSDVMSLTISGSSIFAGTDGLWSYIILQTMAADLGYKHR